MPDWWAQVYCNLLRLGKQGKLTCKYTTFAGQVGIISYLVLRLLCYNAHKLASACHDSVARYLVLRFLTSSIRIKMLVPYILLATLVGMVGAYVVTNLVFSSIQERLDRQLVTAGRVANDTIVEQEQVRLEILRQVSRTQGMGLALREGNSGDVGDIISTIAANSAANADSFVVLNDQGNEVFRLQKAGAGGGAFEPPLVGTGVSYDWDAVGRVLRGEVDTFGDKFAVLGREESGSELLLYTIGPVQVDDDIVGVVMIGQYLDALLEELKTTTQADITLYNNQGEVLGTTFGGNQEGFQSLLRISPDYYNLVLQASSQETTLKQDLAFEDQADPTQVSVLGQNYVLAYSPFIIRGEVIGVFSVGVLSDFIIETTNQSRNIFAGLVFLAVVVLLAIALLVTQTILRPVARLVDATRAIAAGDLNRRTGIKSNDEIGHLASAFDVMTVNLKQRTDELIEETSKVNAILRSIADGVLVQDRNGEIITTNPAGEDLLNELQTGFYNGSIAELSGLSTNTPLATEDQSFSDFLSELSRLGRDRARRFHIGKRAISALAAPVQTTEGESLGTVLVLRDITQEIEVERLKNEFIGNISHELRTPLVPIIGYLDLLTMTAASKLDERDLGLMKRIRENLDDLDRLIFTLIADAELEAGTLGVDEAVFDLDELIQRVADDWKERIEARELSFNVEIESADLSVYGDESRLSSVLDYLLTNASTYIYPQGSVTLRLRREDGQARIDVTDTGVGISEADQSYIFTRFFRALHEDFYEERGFGLGLYISKAIVTRHGGDIWFETAVNQGSTFSVALPLVSDEEIDKIFKEDPVWDE